MVPKGMYPEGTHVTIRHLLGETERKHIRQHIALISFSQYAQIGTTSVLAFVLCANSSIGVNPRHTDG